MSFTDKHPKPIRGGFVRGAASGVIFIAFFSTLWAQIGIMGLQGWGTPWLTIATILVGLALFGGSMSLLLTSRRLQERVARAEAQERRSKNKWFRIIFLTEGVLILIAAFVCNAVNRFDLFLPVMVLIVGVHFFPLAAVFRENIHYLAGALLCLLVTITLLVVPERADVGNLHIVAWEVILGFCSALILWGDGLALWLQGKRLLAYQEQ
jgi:hypothetical protein